MKRLEEKAVSVQAIEQIEGSETYSVGFGEERTECSIVVPFPDVQKFQFGEKYRALFQVCGIPDFVGDDHVCTVSYHLTHLFDSSGKKVYESNEEIPSCY